ncbi:MAG: type II toxin-antitoxin system RelE/ParE family toxin [Rhodospirillales bacterium]|nr:type II toxin-antitoxin system RelE/ParE family toxin [Rhodospirillales bacterium]
MEIRWLKSALHDLEALRAYFAEDDPGAAERVFDQILAGVERLADLPHLGRSGRVKNTRELIIPATPFIVPYRIHEGRVVILAVIHSARRWPLVL